MYQPIGVVHDMAATLDFLYGYGLHGLGFPAAGMVIPLRQHYRKAVSNDTKHVSGRGNAFTGAGCKPHGYGTCIQ